MAPLRTFRIFVSSPGDVAEERALSQRVIQRLQGELAGRAELEPIFWEHEPLLATASFQEQIIQPSATDIVVSILWSRLGTRLPAQFTRADGSRYASGTEFEFEDAVAGFRKHGKPQLLVYRRTAEALVRLDDRKALLERLQQKEALDAFIQRWFHDVAEGTLVAAFHPYAAPGQFEEMLETHLRKLITRELPAIPEDAPQVAFAPWKEGSPYRGLQAFDLVHAPVFFGRSRAVGEVLDGLRRQAASGRAFMVVLGASGSGKSSLLRAGVMPLLTQPGVIEGVGLWRSTQMRPDDSRAGGPFAALAAAFLRPGTLPELLAGGTDVAQLTGLLRQSPDKLPALIRRALSWAAMDLTMKAQLTATPRARFALVVDQLEELFTLERLAGEREAFAAALAVLARSVDVWVLTALRSDCYPAFASIADFVALKEGAGQFDLMPPTPAEIGQMIRQPALAAGVRLEEDRTTGERLEDLLRDAAVANPQALPLLEFTLEELYQRRSPEGLLTLAAYRDLGGVEGALVYRAEQTFASLEPTVQAAFGPVMRALVRLGDEPDAPAVDQRAPRDHIVTSEASARFVDAFIASRLFVADLTDDDEAVVGLAHRALLRHWPRLAQWVEADRQVLRARSHLAAATARWIEEGRQPDFLLASGKPLAEAGGLLARPDVPLATEERSMVLASLMRGRHAHRLRGAAQVGLVVLAFAAVGSAVIATVQRQRAQLAARRAEEVSTFLAGMFEVADPSRAHGGGITVRGLLDEGVARVHRDLADQPLAQARVMTTIGDLYRRLGDLAKAEPLLVESEAIRRRELPAEHPDLAESLDRLGRLRAAQGRYDVAEKLLRQAVGIRRQALGDDAPVVAESLTALGGLLRQELGRFADAEVLLRDALAIRVKAYGTESAAVAESQTELAGALVGKGDLAAAEALYREVLDLRRRVGGNGSLEVAAATHDLAEFLSQVRGNPAAAEPLYRDALARERRILGDQHPDVAWTLNDLGLAVAKLGRGKEAEDLLRQALVTMRQAVGERHPDVASVLDNLALQLQKRGDSREAEQLMRSSLAIRQEHFGADDYQTSWSYHNLGTFLARHGQLAEAASLLEKALAIRRRLFVKDHMDLAVTLESLGTVRVKQGQAAAGLEMLREALAIYRHLLTPGDPYLAVMAYEVGRVELLAGNPTAAVALLEEAAVGERRRGREQALAAVLEALAQARRAAAGAGTR